MLLRLLGEALTRAHRLPAADGLTAGAIARRADLDSDAGARGARAASRRPPTRRVMRRTPPRERAARGSGDFARKALLAKIRAPAGGGADARARHRIPARAGRARRVLRHVAAPGAVARSGRRHRRGRPPPNGAAMATPALFEWLRAFGRRRAFVPRALHRASRARRRRRAATCWSFRCRASRCSTTRSSARSTSGCGAAIRC